MGIAAPIVGAIAADMVAALPLSDSWVIGDIAIHGIVTHAPRAVVVGCSASR
jgi:hypothetical protein